MIKENQILRDKHEGLEKQNNSLVDAINNMRQSATASNSSAASTSRQLSHPINGNPMLRKRVINSALENERWDKKYRTETTENLLLQNEKARLQEELKSVYEKYIHLQKLKKPLRPKNYELMEAENTKLKADVKRLQAALDQQQKVTSTKENDVRRLTLTSSTKIQIQDRELVKKIQRLEAEKNEIITKEQNQHKKALNELSVEKNKEIDRWKLIADRIQIEKNRQSEAANKENANLKTDLQRIREENAVLKTETTHLKIQNDSMRKDLQEIKKVKKTYKRGFSNATPDLKTE